jgi:hypothetical protein
MSAAEPAAPGRRTIGLKPTRKGAAGVATITRISFSEDDDRPEAHVSVRYGPKPRKDKKGMTIGPWPDTSELRVPMAVAQKLRVGQRCRISLEPVGASSYADEEAAEGE